MEGEVEGVVERREAGDGAVKGRVNGGRDRWKVVKEEREWWREWSRREE